MSQQNEKRNQTAFVLLKKNSHKLLKLWNIDIYWKMIFDKSWKPEKLRSTYGYFIDITLIPQTNTAAMSATVKVFWSLILLVVWRTC